MAKRRSNKTKRNRKRRRAQRAIKAIGSLATASALSVNTPAVAAPTEVDLSAFIAPGDDRVRVGYLSLGFLSLDLNGDSYDDIAFTFGLDNYGTTAAEVQVLRGHPSQDYFSNGDANGDQAVDEFDLVEWELDFQNQFGVADFDQDGFTTGLDFLIWQRLGSGINESGFTADPNCCDPNALSGQLDHVAMVTGTVSSIVSGVVGSTASTGMLAYDLDAGGLAGTGNGNFFNVGSPVFMGFQFASDNGEHFGWAEVNVEYQDLGFGLEPVIEIYRIGYESLPSTPIIAGSPTPPPLTPVPEPGGFSLLAVGAAGVATRRRKTPAS